MRKPLLTTLLHASLALVAGLGAAEIGAIDNVPAASLLLPRFEVQLTQTDGSPIAANEAKTTFLSINNADDEPVLAHVTIWSEWFIPVLSFDVYLTGYDVQAINLYGVIVNGRLTSTGPADELSNLGVFSQGPHSTFSDSCSTALGSAPNYDELSPVFMTDIQEALTGRPRTVGGGLCSSSPGQEYLARGFVTVDVVRICSSSFPTEAGYFIDGGNGVATNDNVLWGDYFIVDPQNNFAQGWSLVHLEADGLSLGVASGSCDVTDRNPSTFYCTLRNSDVVAGEDNREGLPSVYLTRYLAGGAFNGGTQLFAWRDKNGIGANSSFDCASGPEEVVQQQIVVFDEAENPLIQGTGPGGEPVIEDIPFPYSSSSAQVGVDITVGVPFGWLFLNLNDGGAPLMHRQGFVTSAFSGLGRFSVGFDPIAVNNLTLGTDTRRGPRNSNPTLGLPPNPNAPTLFN